MDFTTIALMLLMLLAFWFLVLRPQRRRQAEHNKRVQSLQPGTRVMLASGVYATLTAVGEKTMRAEIAPGVEIEVLRQAVAEIVEPTPDSDAVTAPAAPAGEAPTAAPTSEAPTADTATDGAPTGDRTGPGAEDAPATRPAPTDHPQTPEGPRPPTA